MLHAYVALYQADAKVYVQIHWGTEKSVFLSPSIVYILVLKANVNV